MWKIIDFERIKAFYRASIAMLRSLNFWLILGFTLGVISFGIYNRAIANPYTHPNLSQFDPDIYPVINVIHTPPVLLRSDETIRLNFVLVCGYIQSIEDSCHPDATLFLERGVPGTTTEIALESVS